MSENLIGNIAIEVFEATANTRWCFVTITTSEGHRGFGEATLQRHEREILQLAEHLLPRFVGQPADPSTASAHRPESLVGSAIASAVSQALWDAHGKASGRSVTELLGGRSDGSVAVYANINRRTADRSPEGFAKSAVHAFNDGHRAFKIAPFDEVLRGTGTVQPPATIAKGIERIAAVRQAIGSQCELMVDCHWRLVPELALAVIEACRPYKLHWIECPLAETPENLMEIRALRKAANAEGILLAGCELCVGIAGFEPFLAAEAYDVVMPDIKYIGSLEEMVRLWERLSGAGVQLSPHNPSGPVSHAATLHVCNALSPDIRSEMQFDETPLFWSLAPTLPRPVDGRSALTSGTGLGCDLAAEELAEHGVHRREYAR